MRIGDVARRIGIGGTVALGMLACAGTDRAAADPSSVSVSFLGHDSTGARFRVCNNGFQEIRHVQFTTAGATFSADTTLGQAHCADVASAGEYPRLDSSTTVVVTKVERP